MFSLGNVLHLVTQVEMGPEQSRARLFPVGHFLLLVSPYFRLDLPHRNMCNHATGSCLFLGAAAELASHKAWSYFQPSFGHRRLSMHSLLWGHQLGNPTRKSCHRWVKGLSDLRLPTAGQTHLIFAVSHCTKEENTRCHTLPHLGTSSLNIRVCSC